jgi:hypothetical protein
MMRFRMPASGDAAAGLLRRAPSGSRRCRPIWAGHVTRPGCNLSSLSH